MMDWVYYIMGSSDFLLYVSAAGTFFFVAFLATIIILMRQHTARLERNFSLVTRELREAEEIGKFGNFVWDFENPAASFWSEHMYQLCGMKPRRTPPPIDTILQIVHEKEAAATKMAWERAIKQPGPFSISFRARLMTGQERYLQLIGKTVLDADNRTKLVKGVAHDVTKEKEIDTAKTEFVSLASHQLKTPLTAVKWFSETLLGGKIGELTDQQKQYIAKIQEENARMMSMISDLLNVSRLELGTLAVHLETVDVNELATGVLAEQQATADAKHVSVVLSVAADIPPVTADKGLLRMIFQNLLSNAIKYTPEHGTVECTVALGAVRSDTITIRVVDSGIGIPQNEQGRVFEKMHRAKNAREQVQDGTGLGLYMVKNIVDRAKGNITFTSTEGKGTTFLVTLPIVWDVREHERT